MILVESETWAIPISPPLYLFQMNAVSLSPAFPRQVERMNNDNEEKKVNYVS